MVMGCCCRGGSGGCRGGGRGMLRSLEVVLALREAFSV